MESMLVAGLSRISGTEHEVSFLLYTALYYRYRFSLNQSFRFVAIYVPD